MQKENNIQVEKVKERFQKFFEKVSSLKNFLQKSAKYKGYKFYRKKVDETLKEVNKHYIYLKKVLLSFQKPMIREKLEKLDELVRFIIAPNVRLEEKLERIRELEFLQPELEVEIEEIESYAPVFEIPPEIPMNEVRLDIEESIKNYEEGCYLSALVMCRRAYEGAVTNIFKLVEKREPIEEIKCKNCGALITRRYMGIAKLHKWAVKNGLVTQKLQQAGFLISDIGAGGAHPLSDFPRDKQIAKLGILTTLTLLKELYSKSKNIDSKES